MALESTNGKSGIKLKRARCDPTLNTPKRFSASIDSKNGGSPASSGNTTATEDAAKALELANKSYSCCSCPTEMAT